MSGIVGGAGSKSGVIGITELDYEEGTWTPTVSTGGAAFGSVPKCSYIRVGKLCYINFFWYFGATGDTNAAYGDGLPFPAVATAYPATGFSSDIGTTNISFRINPSGWRILTLHNDGNVTWAALSGKYCASGITYEIA